MSDDPPARAVDPWTLGVPPLSACPSRFVDLSGSHSADGCSPYVTRRLLERVQRNVTAWRPALDALRAALSVKFSITENRISLGAGCRVLLPALLRALAPNGKVVTSGPPPPLYRLAALQAAVELVEVPYRNGFRHDAERLAEMLTQVHPAILLLGHPINPSGQFLSRDEIHAIVAEAKPTQTLILVDETYGDFAQKPEFPRLAPLLEEMHNLALLRSFSSLQGLSPLPAAYLLSSAPVASTLQPFLIGSEPGELAAVTATASVEETSFDLMIADKVGRTRFHLAQTLREWRVPCEVGLGPWVMIGTRDGTDAARRLAAHGMRVRDLTSWGFDNWLRVLAASAEDVAQFLERARPLLVPTSTSARSRS